MESPSASSVTSFHTADETSPWKQPPEVIAIDSSSPSPVETTFKTEKTEKTPGSTQTIASVDDTPKEAKAEENIPVARKAAQKDYHPVRRLPYELKDHVRVFLEERMYGEAINLLTSLLAGSGGPCESDPTTGPQPVWIPPPTHLAVLATLMVHPAYTSRPKDDGTDMRVAGHAMQYLRHILNVAGPVQADLGTAFAFPETLRQRRMGGGSRRRSAFNNSANSSRPQSRPQSRPRRLRVPAGRSALNGDSDFVDVTQVKLEGDDKGGMDRVSAALRAHSGGDGATGANGTASNKDKDDDYGHRHVSADSHSMYPRDDNSGFLDDEDDFDDDAVGARMATKDSVWVRGHDFWRVAGWAFSCSVHEPARWRYWRPWLSLVVDVLEADLIDRIGAGDDPTNSLLYSYLDGHSTHTHIRRVVAAIVADGSQQTIQREVFDKEVAHGSHGSIFHSPGLSRTRVLDLDNSKFGDYSDDDESAPPSSPLSALSASPFGAKQQNSPFGRGPPVTAETTIGSNPGFVESLPLRRRLMYLLVVASHYFRKDFVATDMVYRTFADVLRESDISVFASFIEAPAAPSPALADGVAALWQPPLTQIPPPTANAVLVGLLRHVLFPMMPHSAPKPGSVDPEADLHFGVSPLMLERCFLPFAANTVALGANVRMALAIESLFRVLWTDDETNSKLWTPSLKKAAETGVQARATRAKAPKRSTEVEALGRDMLQRSGKRLLTMVKLAKMDAE